MQRVKGVLILLSICLIMSNPSKARSQAPDFSTENAPQAQDRLVVFEGFLRST